jgi:IS30 family transposase
LAKFLNVSFEWLATGNIIENNQNTYDNGKEFSGHEQVNKSINCKSYFAKPYHSWERGQNENVNGLLRQYFPTTGFIF